ncbi:MAG: phage holin family protein [Flavobacteriaceae bacterium]
MTTQETLKEMGHLTQKYVVEEYEHAKLKLFYQAVSFTSSTANKTLVGVVGLLALSFVSIGIAFWLGSLLDSMALGFLVVGAFYLLLTLVVFLLRRKVERYVIQKMAAKYF